MQTITKRSIGQKNRHNPLFDDFQIISCKQIELIFKIREYRAEHDLTQKQFTDIANVYGAPYKVKFAGCDVSLYERFKLMPSMKKMCVLLKTIGINLEDLNYTARE